MLPLLWERCVERYPHVSAEQERALPVAYRMHPAVPVSKLTLAEGNPTLVHGDSGNSFITILIAFGSRLGDGGWHMLVDAMGEGGVIVQDAPFGVVVLGPHSVCMHGNWACMADKTRFILNAYCDANIVEWVRRARASGGGAGGD